MICAHRENDCLNEGPSFLHSTSLFSKGRPFSKPNQIACCDEPWLSILPALTQGQISSSWTPTWTRNQEMIKMKFGFAGCSACPVRAEVVPKHGDEASLCAAMRLNLRKIQLGNANKLRSLRSCMPGAQASKAFMRKARAHDGTAFTLYW